ncbi:MAG: 4-hydroxy-tetrahydrodipicolinate synthase [Candidatus Nanopelagicales bacterium]
MSTLNEADPALSGVQTSGEPGASPFGTILTAMITPMNDDLSVDYNGAAKLANYLVDLGNDGLVVSGTTGESPTTTDSEKLGLLEVVLEAVGDRARVIAGAGTNNTAHSVELATAAADAGAHGILAVTPYYNKPPVEGVIKHYETLAEVSDLPIMLYDIPGRTGLALEPETLVRLAEIPQIVAVKDAKGDLESVVEVMSATDLLWYSGDDGLNLAFLSIGATGFVSVTGHLVADRLRAMREAFLAGRVDEAKQINESLQPVSTGIFRSQGAIMTKAALNELELPAGPMRLPLVDATPVETAQLIIDLAEGGVQGFTP